MDTMSIVRTIVLIFALINQLLTISGYSPLPFSDQEVESFSSTAIVVIASLWAWWKNNYLSKRGQKQKEVLQQHNLYKP